MDTSIGLVDLQCRAQAFLYAHLRERKTSLSDIIQEVVKLAAEDGNNPLKDLVRTADKDRSAADRSSPPTPPSVPGREASTPQPVRQRSSKFTLRFSRTKDRPANAANGLTPHASTSATKEQQDATRAYDSEMWINNAANLGVLGLNEVKDERRNVRATAIPTASSKQAKAKAASTVTYSCVFCGENYSSKGTCKRHLDDMHVARRFLQCNKCRARFKTVPEARKHCDPCSSSVLGWTDWKPPPRQLYSSEFDNKVFRTQQQYTDHLLELCAKPRESRPGVSVHRKLYNLLEQPGLQEPLTKLSFHLFGAADGWRNVRWEYNRVMKATVELENGIPDLRPSPPGMPDNAVVFLDQLFADRKLHTSAASHPASNTSPESGADKRRSFKAGYEDETPRSGMQPLVGAFACHQMASLPEPASHATEAYYPPPTPTGLDFPSKRPLSYESAARVPERMPPGPPSNVPTVHHHHGALPFHHPEYPSITTTSSSSHYALEPPPPLSSPMAQWPFSDQPPPYESMLYIPINDNNNHNNLPPLPPPQTPMPTSMSTAMIYYTTTPIPTTSTTHFTPDAQAGAEALSTYPPRFATDYHGLASQYHVNGGGGGGEHGGQDPNVSPWNPLAHSMTPNPPQHFESGTEETDSGMSLEMYEGGILDSLC